MPIIREVNTSLVGVDTVDQIPQAEVSLYEKHKTSTSFILPIKVPAAAERFMDDGKHYTKSNLNVSYAALNAICGQALSACDLCMKTREESKRCHIRRAYDMIPAMKLAAKQNSMDAAQCPYVGLEVLDDDT